ncbi:uncharacterized protein LOC126618271 [Malus sylvestris]|uniref:uncharacterized protein LOC126618271 n=1 Tax=Malus sylvestris TaxID=3752 RepID=UPI0021AC7468|nr:uncharacterized protein LOC126618271 [Malus sylvestris]
MSALEILRETVRILWYNLWGFLVIALLLICPVSALLLSNLVVDQSLVKRLTIRMLLIAKSSVLPLRDFISHSCQKFAEMAISFLLGYMQDMEAGCFNLCVVAGCVVLFLVLLLVVCNACSMVGLSPNYIVYAAVVVALACSVVFANAVIICNIAIVINAEM